MTEKNYEYINNHLIAYIGNKRRLIPLLEKAIKRCKIEEKNPKFLDLFAGTGVVSRLAKSLNFEVYANDWEYYSYILNKAFLELDEDFLNNSFKKLGGIDNVLKVLNELKEPLEKDKYISIYYCPLDDENPDLKNERLFYTSYNGKKIDAVRAKIEEWKNNNFIDENEEILLLALLLYEASTRSNTSGVFKAFHKGFGGTNHDALSRILKLISFKKPVLINGPKAKIFKEDSVKLVKMLKEIRFDIAYLDPPYNQHQYGSNYHLLNTIALNDKPPVNKNIYINGKKVNKSAIRRDWIKTKSSFCYKDQAIVDFTKIIENLNAHYILLSYSTDGIIPFDTILEILSRKGKLDIVMSEYVKYRGGKQSLTREIKNIEFVLIVNTEEQSNPDDIIRIKKKLLMKKIKLYLKKSLNPIRAGMLFFNKEIRDEFVIFTKFYKDIKVELIVSENKIVNHNIDLNDDVLPYETVKEICEDLATLTNMTKEDEIYLIINELKELYNKRFYEKAISLFKNIPYLLSKFNNKKAYIPSLKTIVNVMELLIQTIDMWKKVSLIKSCTFRKFELIIFKKLNYVEYRDIKASYIDDPVEYEKKVDEYKRKISTLYEYFIMSVTDEKERIISDIKAKELEILLIRKKKLASINLKY